MQKKQLKKKHLLIEKARIAKTKAKTKADFIVNFSIVFSQLYFGFMVRTYVLYLY